MKKKKTFNKDTLYHYLTVARKYAALIMLLFLVGIYGFLAWRILSLMQAEPDQADISAQLKTVGVPKVDQSVIDKMQRLENNSVPVKTLFDQARSNPFSE